MTREVKLRLPKNASKQAIQAKLKSETLFPYQKFDKITKKPKTMDKDWNKDIDSFLKRPRIHIESLIAIVDDYREIVGWIYEEDPI